MKTTYLFDGEEFQEGKNQMPVQKMGYLGGQVVVRHLYGFKKNFINRASE